MTIIPAENHSSWDTGKVALVVYATTIGIGGLLANGLVIFVFAYYKYLRTVTNNFIINLAVCDFVIALLDLAFSIPSLIASEWIFGHEVGILYAFLHFFLVSSSMAMLATIAVDRYYVIARSKLRTRITSKKSLLVIAMVYMYTLIIASPILYAPAILKVKVYRSGCYIDFSSTMNFGSISYSVVMVIFLYLVPLITIVLHYWKIFNVLMKRRKRACWTNAKQNRRLNDKSRRGFCKTYTTRAPQVKTLRVMAILVGLFLVTWTPYMVVTQARAFNQYEFFSDDVKEITIQLIKSVVVLNPIAYALVNHRFQKCIAKFFCCSKVMLGGTTADNSLDFYRPSKSNRTSANEPYRSSYSRQDIPKESSISEELAQNNQQPVQFVYNDNDLREDATKPEQRHEECHKAGNRSRLSPSRNHCTSAHEPYRSSYSRQDIPSGSLISEELSQNSQQPVQFVYNDNHIGEDATKPEPRHEACHKAWNKSRSSPSRNHCTSAHEPYRSSYSKQDIPSGSLITEELSQNSQQPVQFVYSDNHLGEDAAKPKPTHQECHKAGKESRPLEVFQGLGIDISTVRSADWEILVTYV